VNTLSRKTIEMEIERLINLLDTIDGDPDYETEDGSDQDVNRLSLNPAWQRPAKRLRRAA
jgi:hypothetical protein